MSERLNMRLTVPKGTPLYEHLKDLVPAAARHELIYLANCGLRLNRSGQLMASPVPDVSSSGAEERNVDLQTQQAIRDPESEKDSAITQPHAVDVGDLLDTYT